MASLPVVSVDGVAPAAPVQAAASAPAPTPANATPLSGNAGNLAESDIFATIDKLAELRSRNILTEAEFQAKKTEFLARL